MRIRSGTSSARLLGDAAIVLALTAGLLAVAEMIVRLIAPQNLRGTSVVGESFSLADERVGLRYVPGAHWRFEHPEYAVEYQINEHGLRDARQHPVSKPEGTTRILLLGDSFTFGQGVSYEDSWPALVERALQNAGRKDVEVVKAGVQGMDTRSELLMLRRLSEVYDPDAVVITFMVNDLYTNSLSDLPQVAAHPLARQADTGNASWSETMTRVFVENERDVSSHLLRLFRRLVISVPEVYCRLYLMNPNRSNWFRDPLPSAQSRQVEVTDVLLDEIADVNRERGDRLAVFSIPQQFQVLYRQLDLDVAGIDVDTHDRRFASRAAQKDVPWIASLADFVSASERSDELLYHRLDGHLTAAGNRVAADSFLTRVLPALIGPEISVSSDRP